MSKFKVSLVKKSAQKMKAPSAASAAGPVVAFEIVDNEDSSCTVLGVNAAGNTVDISSVATLAVTSSDPSIASVDTPVGMTFLLHAIKAGPASIGAVATWNDGSVGPFGFDLPLTVQTGPAGGIVIVPGPPVPRP